jgi:acylphosphatase
LAITLPDTVANAVTALELGAVVNVTYPRFGLDAGKKFRVLGIVPNFADGTVELTLWG